MHPISPTGKVSLLFLVRPHTGFVRFLDKDADTVKVVEGESWLSEAMLQWSAFLEGGGPAPTGFSRCCLAVPGARFTGYFFEGEGSERVRASLLFSPTSVEALMEWRGRPVGAFPVVEVFKEGADLDLLLPNNLRDQARSLLAGDPEYVPSDAARTGREAKPPRTGGKARARGPESELKTEAKEPGGAKSLLERMKPGNA